MTQRLLEGEVVDRPDGVSSELQRLRETVARLTRERDESRREAIELQQRMRNNDAPIARLRQQLEPLYRALQGIWGEFDEIAPDAQPATPGQPAGDAAKSSPVWDSWKQRLGETVAKGITALQTHGELSTQQMAIVTGLHRKTITNTVIYRLNQANLINKNGGRFSLKQI